MKAFRNLSGEEFTIVCNKDELQTIFNGLFKVYLRFKELSKTDENETLKIADNAVAEKISGYCNLLNDIERG